MKVLRAALFFSFLVLSQIGCAALSKENRMVEKQIHQSYVSQISMSTRCEAGNGPRLDPDSLALNPYHCPRDGAWLAQFELVERSGGGTEAYYCSKEKIYWIRVWTGTAEAVQGEIWYGPFPVKKA